MSKPFDPTIRDLLEVSPVDWVRLLGADCPPESVHVVDSDLSSVSSEADKVLRVEVPTPWILHVEFQTRHELDLPLRVKRYNSLPHERHGVPVASAVVLLRPEANASSLTDQLDITTPVVPVWTFSYRVIRVWELAPDLLMAQGQSLMMLAPIAIVSEVSLPNLVHPLQR